jgi:hypothetical protein
MGLPAPGQAKKVAMLGSFDHVTRQLIVHTSPTKRSSDFVVHLERHHRVRGVLPAALPADTAGSQRDPTSARVHCQPRTTLSEAVAYGEMGFLPTLPATGQAAAEVAALVAELRSLEWLPQPMSRTNM